MNPPVIPSPCFILEEDRLIRNLQLMKEVQERSAAKIILAFKGFAMWNAFPLVREFLPGATASSLYEARLCKEEMRVPAHTYMVAYPPTEFQEIASLSSHLTFNSWNQWYQFSNQIPDHVSCGMRINPGWSDVITELYNPAGPHSRLGVTSDDMPGELPPQVEGLHFHVLCESNSFSLERVLQELEQKFEKYLHHVKWLNMGGGHLMTSEGYDVEHLVGLLKSFREKYDLEIILEPGSAVGWQTGDLHATVLDVIDRGGVHTAIADISFTCHMPDCLEMPYRPDIRNAHTNPEKGTHQYRIGGVSCLAGDFLDAYGFEHELRPGDPLVFEDMMHYTMVKTSMFNGVQHPSIGKITKGKFELIRTFDYQDYKSRLS